MATLYDIKPKFQALLRPVVRGLAANSVTANQITLLAAVMSIATGALLFLQIDRREFLLLVPVVLFVRMALNAIDGMLAREHGMKSPLGAILNELCDVLSDAALYLPFAMLHGIVPVVVVVFVIFAITSEMAGVVAVQIGASRRYDGPLGKSDRAFLFGAIALLAGFGVPIGQWTNWVLIGANALLICTIINRSRRALGEICSRA